MNETPQHPHDGTHTAACRNDELLGQKRGRKPRPLTQAPAPMAEPATPHKHPRKHRESNLLDW